MKNAFIRNIRSIHQDTVDQLEGLPQTDWDAIFQGLIQTQQLCYQRYMQHIYLCRSLDSKPMETLFERFARDHLEELETLRSRLNGEGMISDDESGANPKVRVSLYTVSSGINRMVKENLTAERLSFQLVSEILELLKTEEPFDHSGTGLQDVLSQIAEHQEQRLNRLADLLEF